MPFLGFIDNSHYNGGKFNLKWNSNIEGIK